MKMTLKTFMLSMITLTGLYSCSSEKPEKNTGNPEEAVSELTDEASAQEGPAYRKYDIKSGVVNFEMDQLGIKGKKDLYFDDYGAKERVEYFEEDGTLREISLSNGKTRYTLIPKDKTAYLVDENGNLGWEMQFTPWDKIREQPDYEKTYKKEENMNIAGNNCEAFTYGSMATFAGCKGLTLYHKQGPDNIVRAVKFEEGPVAADKFQLPADFKIHDLRRN